MEWSEANFEFLIVLSLSTLRQVSLVYFYGLGELRGWTITMLLISVLGSN